MIRLAVASAFGLATLLACPCAGAQSAGEWGSSAQLWRATCSYCHDNGVARELRGAGLTPQAVATAVRVGPKAMPSFTTSQISDRELEQLAEWMSTQKPPAPQAIDRSTRESRHGSRERSR
ncbi:MAG TPA: cytochrome c [Steroidobacteraceae bacterium]|jgi:mono/diheme cytochrome c family protein